MPQTAATSQQKYARRERSHWDAKAARYPRYGRELGCLHRAALDAAGALAGARVIDVGAGTGVFSLHLAAAGAAELAAQDVSPAMLALLREDFLRLNLPDCSLETICCDFSDYAAAKRYDIAFCTLSPALSQPADFAKFHALAGRKIYASWREHRRSSLLDPLIARFGRSNWRSSAEVCEEFLRGQKIEFFAHDINEQKCLQKPMAQALEDCLWHLGLNNLARENAREEVANYLAERADENGCLRDEIATFSRIYIWR